MVTHTLELCNDFDKKHHNKDFYNRDNKNTQQFFIKKFTSLINVLLANKLQI